MAFLEARMDVTRNGGAGRDLDPGTASCQQILQLSVVDGIDGPVVSIIHLTRCALHLIISGLHWHMNIW